MDHIRQAVERAKGQATAGNQPQAPMESIAPLPPFPPTAPGPAARSAQFWGDEVLLSSKHLESKRIIAYDITDPRAKTFDMLRTQVLRTMDMKSWQFLGVTSPTAGCGKTMVSINLALSIARQHERSVLLVDMDLQKPQVANSLGLRCDKGIVSVLEGETDLTNSIIRTTIGDQDLLVLPCETSTLRSSEWMSSRVMGTILQSIRREFRHYTVIVDLPPTLTSDDVISILPQIDCVLPVAAVGTTTIAQIKECNKHLEAAPIVRVVLNKAADMPTTYYARYADAKVQAPKPASGPRN